MAILVDASTRVLCQGFTGRQATFYSERAIAGGTRMVGGVTPGKGGTRHLGLPVFDSVAEALEATGADASVVFAPRERAGAAMAEAVAAGIALVVCISERVPVLDMVRVREALAGSATVLVGPNCPGVVAPGRCAIGIMPRGIFRAGRIGIVSRASTLTYEAIAQTTASGLGQSTVVGIGADPVHGIGFVEVLERMMGDAQTEGVVLIGEIGGDEEERAARWLAARAAAGESLKPVVAYVAGREVPEGRRMGHAGAIVAGGRGTARAKIAALSEAGVAISASPSRIGETMLGALG